MQSAYMQGQVGEFWAVGVFLWERPERVSVRGGMVPRVLVGDGGQAGEATG